MAYGWMIGLALVLMAGNFYLLFSLIGFDVDAGGILRDDQVSLRLFQSSLVYMENL